MEFERKYKSIESVAKLIGKSTEEIIKLIESNKLTAVKDENDEWIIPIYYSKGIRYVNSERS